MVSLGKMAQGQHPPAMDTTIRVSLPARVSEEGVLDQAAFREALQRPDPIPMRGWAEEWWARVTEVSLTADPLVKAATWEVVFRRVEPPAGTPADEVILAPTGIADRQAVSDAETIMALFRDGQET